MNILALDTSTEACSAALLRGASILEHFEVVGRGHTERLLPMLQALMAEAGLSYCDLDGLVCGIGPGSFAGVRIGVGVAKGLGLARDLPAVGVSSLAMLAQSAIDGGADTVLSCIDARMGEVYFGAFHAGPDRLALAIAPERVCPPATVSLQPPPANWAGVGSGWGSYAEILKTALAFPPASLEPAALPRAGAALKLALPRFAAGKAAPVDDLAPAYLRDRVALTLAEQTIARQALRR